MIYIITVKLPYICGEFSGQNFQINCYIAIRYRVKSRPDNIGKRRSSKYYAVPALSICFESTMVFLTGGLFWVYSVLNFRKFITKAVAPIFRLTRRGQSLSKSICNNTVHFYLKSKKIKIMWQQILFVNNQAIRSCFSMFVHLSTVENQTANN